MTEANAADPAASLRGTVAPPIAARAEADRTIRLAEDALDAERDGAIVPVRRAQLAWSIYRCACLPDQPDAGRLGDRAAMEGEAAVAMAQQGTFGAFQCRLLLSHILIGRLAFIEAGQTHGLAQAMVARATTLALEAMHEAVAQTLPVEHLMRASDLIIAVHETAHALLGDDERLQAAMSLLSDMYERKLGGPAYRLHLATSIAQLRYSHFERTGDPGDLDAAIAVAEDALDDAVGLAADSERRALLFPLSNALASRAGLRHPQHRDGARRPLAADDAKRAVAMARRLVATAGPSAREQALAANALGFALRALGHATDDVAPLTEALAQFLSGLRATPANSGFGVLLANNVATLIGEIEVKETERGRAGVAAKLDDAIQVLGSVLDTAGHAYSALGAGYAPLLFNYADLLIRRRCRAGTADDTARAIEALAACLAWLQPGHPRRPHALSVLAIGLVQPESLQRDPDALERAVSAALEAEAIELSGAPSAGWSADCVAMVETAWRVAGHDAAALGPRRTLAVQSLVSILPEPALELALRRGHLALAAGDTDLAAAYADIAFAARDRAMLVADDPDTATTFAAARQADPFVHRLAVALASAAPDRAALLVERAQGSVIARLQIALTQPDPQRPSDAPALRAFAEARTRLRSVLADRRNGILAATPEAVRAADAALAAAIDAVRSTPGLADFLITIADLPTLKRVASTAAYIVAGETSGATFVLRRDGGIAAVPLPRLTQAEAAQQAQRYLAALNRFEQEGVAELATFLRLMSEAAAWLEAAAWGPVRDALAGEACTLIPAGLLATLPWSAVTGARPVTFAPSLQTLARAPMPRPIAPVLLVSDPGHADQPDLPGAEPMTAWIEALVGEPVMTLSGAGATAENVIAAAGAANTIVFYTHGIAEPLDPLAGGILLHQQGRLDVRAITAHAPCFAGKTIIMAACSQGRIDPDIPGEMLGPATAFLAAGAASVIAPAWPVEALSAQCVAMSFLEARIQQVTPAEALVVAQARVSASASSRSAPMQFAGLNRGRATGARQGAALHSAHAFFASAFSAYGKTQ